MQHQTSIAPNAKSLSPGRDASHVDIEINRLTDAIHQLAEMLSLLGNRIEPVLMPPVPTPIGPSSPLNEIVPMADTIRSRRLQVEDLIERVQSMLHRIEL